MQRATKTMRPPRAMPQQPHTITKIKHLTRYFTHIHLVLGSLTYQIVASFLQETLNQ